MTVTATSTQTILYDTFDSPIGELLATGDGEVVTGLYMQDGRHPVVPGADWERDDEAFAELRRQLGEYFAGERREFDLPLAPRGSEFQVRVWDALREIPYGETESYGELAERIGAPGQRSRGRRRQRPEPDLGRGPVPPGDRLERPAHRLRAAGSSASGCCSTSSRRSASPASRRTRAAASPRFRRSRRRRGSARRRRSSPRPRRTRGCRPR